MLLSPRKNGLTSLFKEVRVFKVQVSWELADMNPYAYAETTPSARKMDRLLSRVLIFGERERAVAEFRYHALRELSAELSVLSPWRDLSASQKSSLQGPLAGLSLSLSIYIYMWH